MKHLLLTSLIILGLSGCALYVPTTAVMPLVKARQEAELTALVHPSGRLEVKAAYSPLSHVVISGTGIVGLWTRGEQYLRTGQGELGLGGYWLLGRNESWLLSTTAGAGLARVRRRDCLIGCSELQGRYGKGFGQAGLAYVGGQVSTSLTYRLSRVQFSQVLDEVRPIADFGLFRHDLTLAVRYPLSVDNAWYTQFAMGSSFSSRQPPNDSQPAGSPPYQQWYAGGVPALVMSFGIGWQPRPRPR